MWCLNPHPRLSQPFLPGAVTANSCGHSKSRRTTLIARTCVFPASCQLLYLFSCFQRMNLCCRSPLPARTTCPLPAQSSLTAVAVEQLRRVRPAVSQM